MQYELSQRFHFDAAHTLERDIDTEASRRIHGHTYRATVTVRGTPDPRTRMVIDLELLAQRIANVRDMLDHRLLDEVEGLGPSTLEGLGTFILTKLRMSLDNVVRVTVERPHNGDCCMVSAE